MTNVFVFGYWSPSLGYALDWLHRAARGSRIETVYRGWYWYRRVVRDGDFEVSSITGTILHTLMRDYLFHNAETILFLAVTTPDMIELAEYAREELEPWIGGRRVAFMFDHGGNPDDAALDSVTMCSRLRVGAMPYFTTNARLGEGLREPFKFAISTSPEPGSVSNT